MAIAITIEVEFFDDLPGNDNAVAIGDLEGCTICGIDHDPTEHVIEYLAATALLPRIDKAMEAFLRKNRRRPSPARKRRRRRGRGR